MRTIHQRIPSNMPTATPKSAFSLIGLAILLAMFTASCNAPQVSPAALRASVLKPATTFTILPDADTTIVGEQGTRIFIERGTFQYADGSPANGPIEMKLEEYYDKGDMVVADLQTVSDGKLLETGGMLQITASSQGKEVMIRADKRIVVHLPKTNSFLAEEMDLFYADNAATDSSVANWKLDTTDLVKRTLEIMNWGWYYPSHDDSTRYDFTPKDLPKEGYAWNPLDFYLNAYDFAPETRKEIETTLNRNSYPNFASWNTYGIECEMGIDKEGWVRNPRVNSKVSAATRKDVLNFLQNMPQLEPGKNKHGDIVERRGLLFIRSGKVVPLYKTRESYLKSFDEKYATQQGKPIRNVDEAEIEYYIFSVANLGWINCDRFIEANDPVDFVVSTPVETGTKLKLVFRDLDGVMEPIIQDGKYVFSRIPRGTDATLVAMKDNGGYLQAAFQPVTISTTPLTDLAYRNLTLDELRTELQKLN